MHENAVSNQIVDYVMSRLSQNPLPKKLNKVKINVGKIGKDSI